MSTSIVKGLAFDSTVAPMVPHMAVVNDHREALQRLQDLWDQLTLLGQMSGIAADMSATATQFQALTQALLDSLAQRLLANAKHELAAKAQMAIDILVRNLFERTADVGFLATDHALREFLADRPPSAVGTGAPALTSASSSKARERLEARFGAYVAKYSVYDDVIVLSPSGEVLSRLDRRYQTTSCAHGLVQESARAGVPFVESFGAIDILDGRRGLIYSAAIRRGANGALLGILCLSFRFEDEMQRVFSHLAPEGGRGAVVLINSDGTVLASSDAWQLPLGARLHWRPGCDQLYFAGRQYLIVVSKAQPYQGYAGPAWLACALLPMTQAFDLRNHRSAPSAGATHATGPVDAHDTIALPAGAMDHSDLFGEELRRIPRQALAIQNGLERSVWNGQIHGRKRVDSGGSARFAAVLLQQVTLTGEKIRGVFEQAIGELQQSAVDSVLDETRLAATLGVDILDRNLYERANDCRWWALDARLQQALLQPDRREEAASVLRHINSLYTVYTQLLLLDGRGDIVASSVDTDSSRADAEWVPRALALRQHQDYVRSSFEPSPFYADRHSYIYGAAVQPPGQRGTALGAVAIVFDAEAQFQAMLHDALPRDTTGAPMPQAIGLFITRGGQIIASTDARFRIGELRELGTDIGALGRGQSRISVLEIDGEIFATGIAMSRGYREYNSAGSPCADDIACVILISLCRRADMVSPPLPVARPSVLPTDADGVSSLEIASFRCGPQWLALPVQEVIEAVDEPGLTVLPRSASTVAGLMVYRNDPLPVLDLVRGAPCEQDAQSTTRRPVIICETSGQRFALRVDELGHVCDAARSAVQPLPDYMGQHDPYAQALIHTREHQGMMVLLDAEKILTRLRSLLPSAGALVSAA